VIDGAEPNATLLDRLEYARGLGIDSARGGRIHTARLTRLIDQGAIMTVQHIADLEPARRTAILVVQAASLETRDERRFQATRRDVARALILFRRTIAALRHAKEAREDGVAVVEREIGMKQLDDVLPVIGAVVDQDTRVTAAERYSVLRRFSPHFLAAFDFRSNTPDDPVLAAVVVSAAAMAQADLRERCGGPAALRNGGARHAARAAKRQQHLGSGQPRAFEDYLLPAEAGRDVGTDGETNPGRYIANRTAALRERLTFVADRAGRGELDGVEIEDGKLFIARPVDAIVPRYH
jgi:hypothetical protein